MNNNILVNKVEIEKQIINQFLIQNKKIEAVKYICDKAGIGLASSKNIVELFQDGEIDNYDGQDLFPENENISQTDIIIEEPKSSNKGKVRLVILALLLLGVFLFLKNVVGFVHIPEHLETLKKQIFTKSNNDNSINAVQAEIATDNMGASDDNTSDVVMANESPIDLRMWENQLKNGEWIPDGVREEIERYKKRDFSKLVKATEMPTDKEAEEAIVNNYKTDVVKLLQEEKAHIKIGVAYNAPLQTTESGDVEIARVTAMVSAFNATRGNLGNIQAPLDVIYDFVKYQSDPGTWYITDFSQSIPYDLKLNKDRW